MTTEAQRIAIAEACPTAIRLQGNFWFWSPNNGRDWNHCLNNDPLLDLNAMHEAEKMHYDQTHGGNEFPYEQNLMRAIVRDNQPCEPHEVNLWSATAAQRAEALLRTLSLWSE